MQKYYLLLTAISLMVFSGCTPATSELATVKKHATVQTYYEQPTTQKQERYQQTMRTVASGIKDDPNYKRIELNTPEKKEWFRTLTYKLWDRQITRYEFIAEGLAQHPDHRYEFEFVVKGFESVCASS